MSRYTRASTDAFHQLKRNALGDYSPDPKANRFPEISTVAAPKATVTFQSLFDAWANDGSRARSSIKRFRIPFLGQFPLFLKETRQHQDPARVTKQDIVAWRDHLRAKGISARTIKGASIAALNAIYAKAVRDGFLSINPVEGVTVDVGREIITREKGYTDDEAKTILLAARRRQPSKRENPRTSAFVRWAPFIGAYTGMRVSEMAQLRKEDVLQHPTEGWTIKVTPEAGGTKSGAFRYVPIHPALIEEGFLDWAASARTGPLFVEPTNKPQTFDSRIKYVQSRVCGFIREDLGIADTVLMPNHSWRHRFITLARRVGMSEEKRDMIVGHESGAIGAHYGDPAGLRAEIDKIPAVIPPEIFNRSSST